MKFESEFRFVLLHTLMLSLIIQRWECKCMHSKPTLELLYRRTPPPLLHGESGDMFR